MSRFRRSTVSVSHYRFPEIGLDAIKADFKGRDSVARELTNSL
jgi:hypothetical protein